MRIGLEMFGTQTEGRHRGVGRYARNLAAALAAAAPPRGHDLVYYAEHGKPTDMVPAGRVRLLKPAPGATLGDAFAGIASDGNPDALDALLLLNPLEMTAGYDAPGRSPAGPRLAALVHDLIPLLFPDAYLRAWPGEVFARRYAWSLERLRQYDLILTNSDATRDDCVSRLGLSPGAVATVGASGDDAGFSFSPGDGPDDREITANLGLDDGRRFVLTVGASDPRKNLAGLIDALAALPEALRADLRLVVAGSLDSPDAVRRKAEGRGVGHQLLLTGRVDDTTLRALYRRCAAFVFPSLYEGFGLPLLEAFQCGAPVVAGRNSAQIEVAGDAALLVNAAEPAAIADAIARVLSDPPLVASLRAAGPSRAGMFTWEAVADRALDALERLPTRRTEAAGTATPPPLETGGSRGVPSTAPSRQPRPGIHSLGKGGCFDAHSTGADLPNKPIPDRPRIAFVSPLPPNPSGVASYAESLAEALAGRVALDLFHDTGEIPFARFGLRRLGVGCHDHRAFERLDRHRPYDGVVYQMGNSPAHGFVLDRLERRPGLLVMHDQSLASFHYERSTRLGPGAFRREIEACHPGRSAEFEPIETRWHDDPAGLVAAVSAAGLGMTGRVLGLADAVVVHSRDAAARVSTVSDCDVHVIPHGATPAGRPSSPEGRRAAREGLGLPADALTVGQFGIVHPTKMNAEAVAAFAAVADAVPGALLLVVGEEADGGLARRAARALGLADRVRFWGRPADDEFHALVAAVDLGVCLRRPPTHGETSGALLHLLRAGVATVVTDVGSFAEFPEGVVARTGDSGSLRATLLALALDAGRRAALGRSAWGHVVGRHAWPLVASLYTEILMKQNGREFFRGPHVRPAPRASRHERGGAS